MKRNREEYDNLQTNCNDLFNDNDNNSDNINNDNNASPPPRKKQCRTQNAEEIGDISQPSNSSSVSLKDVWFPSNWITEKLVQTYTQDSVFREAKNILSNIREITSCVIDGYTIYGDFGMGYVNIKLSKENGGIQHVYCSLCNDMEHPKYYLWCSHVATILLYICYETEKVSSITKLSDFLDSLSKEELKDIIIKRSSDDLQLIPFVENYYNKQSKPQENQQKSINLNTDYNNNNNNNSNNNTTELENERDEDPFIPQHKEYWTKDDPPEIPDPSSSQWHFINVVEDSFAIFEERMNWDFIELSEQRDAFLPIEHNVSEMLEKSKEMANLGHYWNADLIAGAMFFRLASHSSNEWFEEFNELKEEYISLINKTFVTWGHIMLETLKRHPERKPHCFNRLMDAIMNLDEAEPWVEEAEGFTAFRQAILHGWHDARLNYLMEHENVSNIPSNIIDEAKADIKNMKDDYRDSGSEPEDTEEDLDLLENQLAKVTDCTDEFTESQSIINSRFQILANTKQYQNSLNLSSNLNYHSEALHALVQLERMSDAMEILKDKFSEEWDPLCLQNVYNKVKSTSEEVFESQKVNFNVMKILLLWQISREGLSISDLHRKYPAAFEELLQYTLNSQEFKRIRKFARRAHFSKKGPSLTYLSLEQCWITFQDQTMSERMNIFLSLPESIRNVMLPAILCSISCEWSFQNTSEIRNLADEFEHYAFFSLAYLLLKNLRHIMHSFILDPPESYSPHEEIKLNVQRRETFFTVDRKMVDMALYSNRKEFIEEALELFVSGRHDKKEMFHAAQLLVKSRNLRTQQMAFQIGIWSLKPNSPSWCVEVIRWIFVEHFPNDDHKIFDLDIPLLPRRIHLKRLLDEYLPLSNIDTCHEHCKCSVECGLFSLLETMEKAMPFISDFKNTHPEKVNTICKWFINNGHDKNETEKLSQMYFDNVPNRKSLMLLKRSSGKTIDQFETHVKNLEVNSPEIKFELNKFQEM